MIERYCDICERRIGNAGTQQEVHLDRVEIRITRAVDGVWNGGDICIPCIQRVVAEGEFQTQPAANVTVKPDDLVDPGRLGLCYRCGTVVDHEPASCPSPNCPRCEGCGKLADSDDREPWTVWENLPLKSAGAVVIGLVKPIECPDCMGTGKVTGP